jgi:hypothetical protein
MGKDLSPQILRRWEDFEIFEHAHYIVYLPDEFEEDLELIRRDPGVEGVQRFAEYQGISDPVDDEDERWGSKGMGRDEL